MELIVLKICNQDFTIVKYQNPSTLLHVRLYLSMKNTVFIMYEAVQMLFKGPFLELHWVRIGEMLLFCPLECNVLYSLYVK